MKKVLIVLGMFILGMIGINPCYATDNKFIVSGLNFDGDVTLGTLDVASATIADIHIDSATCDDGFANIPYYYSDIAAKSQIAIFQGINLSTTNLVAGGTTYVTADLTQPGYPRNIVVFSSISQNGVPITTAVVAGTVHVFGINSVGISTSEIMALVSTANATAGRGNVAWISISSITIDGVTISEVPVDATILNQICIGNSDKLGLYNSVNTTADIIKVIDNGANSTTYTANAFFRTIQFASTPNGTIDYTVVQNVKQTPRR